MGVFRTFKFNECRGGQAARLRPALVQLAATARVGTTVPDWRAASPDSEGLKPAQTTPLWPQRQACPHDHEGHHNH